MSETEPDWEKFRGLILKRLHAKWDDKSDYLRNLPTLVFEDPKTMQSDLISPTDAIREVSNLSPTGKKIIVAQINLLSRLQT